MTNKPRRWCRGKVCYASAELAERSRRGIVYKDAARGRLKPGVRLICYWCDVCQAFHLGHERVGVPLVNENGPDDAEHTAEAGTQIALEVRTMSILNATPSQLPDRPYDATPKTWTEFKDEVMKLYQPPLRAPVTRRGMEYALRCLDAMGITSTADLKPAIIANLVVAQPASKSPNSVVSLLRYVQAACNYAEKLGYVRISPFRVRSLSTYAKRAPSRGRKHASREEIRNVLEHMKEQSLADGWRGWKAKRLYALTATLAYTGMRAGEAIWLKVSDVDLAEGIIWVVSRVEHRTKTAVAAQPLPMPPALIPIVEAWLPHRMSVPPGFKIDSPDCPWLFPTSRRHAHAPWSEGGPGTKPRDRMKAVAAQVGVIGFGPLVLRHSMATHLMTSWGGSAGLVKRILRHTTEQTAQAWYVHDDIPGLKEAVKNVDF